MKSANLGYPRIGQHREWKKALEAHWAGKLEEQDLHAELKKLRLRHLSKQQEQGIEIIPVGDFTYYDHVLDTATMFGLVPERFGYTDGELPLPVYYAMARGSQAAPACEMTKWFNTNYHYIVPELGRLEPRLVKNRPLEAYREAKEELGMDGRPVIVGLYTFLKLSKGYDPDQLEAWIGRLLPLYGQILRELEAEGAEWVQIDEPILCTTLAADELANVAQIYERLRAEAPGVKLLLQTYFEAVDSYEAVAALPVHGIGLDFVHDGGRNLQAVRQYGFPADKVLGAGLIDGRGIWRAELTSKLETLQMLTAAVSADRLLVQPSCSLLHVPVSAAQEQGLEPALREALAFADEKLAELTLLAQAGRAAAGAAASQPERADAGAAAVQPGATASGTGAIRPGATDAGAGAILAERADAGTRAAHHPEQANAAAAAIQAELTAASRARQGLQRSPARNRTQVQERIARLASEPAVRPGSAQARREAQQARWKLPLLPTTTIGSFPQTAEIRSARSKWRSGQWSASQYEAFLQEQIRTWIALQAELGLDVFVHGEFERNDMVEFFGEKLAGFAFTANGWVQSYGSRCVKPPILYGDVEWTGPMTVAETVYAQSLAQAPVKGMLTGPITILNWSFVRDDKPRSEVAYQIALALREEVEALEAAGIGMIQVDEPALREGLPLKREQWDEYLDWAVRAFRLSTSTVGDETQIHTHMCYSEFQDIIEAIRALDADVISIEASRSHGELIESFEEHTYENGIGLGVYDIHSPRVPSVGEIASIIDRALRVLAPGQFWINPDCGLKTRRDEETVAALRHMVLAAKQAREKYAARALG